MTSNANGVTFVESIRKKTFFIRLITNRNQANQLKKKEMKYANDIQPLSPEAVQGFLDENMASDVEEMHVFRAFDAAYDRADFIRNLAENVYTKKYVKPGTFRLY